MKKLIFSSLILVSAQANAEIIVSANLSGTAKVHSTEITRHKHSLSCYTSGKGDDFRDQGYQDASFGGEQTLNSSGELAWGTQITAPFAAYPRTTKLTTTIERTERGDRTTLILRDEFSGSAGTVHSEKCRHTDGYLNVNNAVIGGSVTIKYHVPANTWAIELRRISADGAVAITNQKPVVTAYNTTSDTVRNSSVILWVEPGQWIEQEIEFANFVGPAQIGKLVVEFVPVARSLSADQVKEFLKAVKLKSYSGTMSAKDARAFMGFTLGMIEAGQDSSVYTKSFTLKDLKTISDEFFRIANSVYPNLADGNSVKVAAAMGAFHVARAVLLDMSAYCQDVEVYLPFTGEKQKVLGLKAASFWLSRSMNYIRTYSYDPAEVFLKELQQLQDKGMTPADIAKDQKLRSKIQSAYKLLGQTMAFDGGPFNRAYVDFNKMASTFKNIQSLGPDQAVLLSQLKEANQSEADFIALFGATVSEFRPSNHSKVNLDNAFAKMEELRKTQASLSDALKKSIRMLSIESADQPGQIVDQVIDLVTNQVNIFRSPVNVPYFDGLRESFYKANFKDLENATRGCFDLAEVK